MLGHNRIRVPIAAIFNFRGFRIMASGVLPVTRDTLVYGSQDQVRCVLRASATTTLHHVARAAGAIGGGRLA